MLRSYPALLLIAALSFLPALGFYYVGEEAIFPISSMEMWQHGSWMKQYLYGTDMQHNPLFNWLIMPISALVGWEHMLVVTRSLTIAATLGSAAVLAWLAQRLFGQPTFAAFAALGYLTMADVSLYHGWLSYVDPLFSLWIFAAIAVLWVAVTEQRFAGLVLSGLLLTAAFLSKALTAYVFYAGALLVLLFGAKERAFLLRWPVLAVQTLIFSAPALWFALLPGGQAQGGRMADEIAQKLAGSGWGSYLIRLLVFPLDSLAWLAPLPLLAVYFWARKRNQPDAPEAARFFRLASWMVLLNFLPYWLSPNGGMRYLMPLYPLLALVAARLIWLSGEAALNTARRWMIAALVLKLIAVLALFPYYQSHYRGKNYDEAAQDILRLTQGYPLYVTDVSAGGLNVAAYIDQRVYPAQALQWPPAQWQSGYVIAHTADPALGQVYHSYRLGGDDLFLLCRGAACQAVR